MKKLLSTALILILSLAVLLIFTGCNDGGPLEPEDVDLDAMDSAERAKFLLEASDRRLSAASSYEQTERVAFEIPGISGLEVLVETKVEGVGTKNYKEQTVTTTTTEDSYGAKTTEFETGGYADGYMYRNWTSAGYGNSVKSSLTAEEYLVHKKESIDLPDPEPRTYKSEKNEDGTWAIAILDFDDEFEDKLVDYIGLSGSMLDVEVDDLSITVDLDENFYPKRFVIDLDIDTNADQTIKVSSMEIQILNVNDTTVTTPDLSDYRMLTDLRIMDKAYKAIMASYNDDKGSFVYDMYMYAGSSGRKESRTDHRVIEYQTKDDGTLKMIMDTNIDGNNRFYVYESGVLTAYLAKDGEQVDSEKIDSLEISAMLYQMQCFAHFDMSHIDKIKYNSETGSYVFTFALTTEIIGQYTGKRLADLTSHPYYTVTVKLDEDGNISACSMNIMMSFGNIDFNLDMSCEQTELTEK